MLLRALLVACLLTSLAVAGCTQEEDDGSDGTSSSSRTTTPPPAQVDIFGSAYAPRDVTIQAGQQVTWTQKDGVTHTVTSDDGAPAAFNSGDLGTGDKYSQSFLKTGTYAYHCKYHGSMQGNVIVT